MNDTARVESLTRRVRSLERRNALLLVALGSVFLLGSAPQEAERRVAEFDEITVGRINVAGPDGVNRIVLAHEMPQAPFQGKMIDRTVPPGMAGMIFCAPNGDEIGGIGASSQHSLFALDYRRTPLEAIGFVQRDGPSGQSTSLVIMDNPSDTVDIDKVIAHDRDEIERLQAMMVGRVSLGVDGHDASLRISDRSGRARVVLGVDAEDNAVIQVLDEERRGGRAAPRTIVPD